jgi:hypothetical protein
LHLVGQPARRHLAPQCIDHGQPAARATTRRAFRFLLIANEYVVPKGLHGMPPP